MIPDYSISDKISESFHIEFEVCGFYMYAMAVHVCEHLNHIKAIRFGEQSDHVCCDLLPWLFRDVVRIKQGM